MFSHHGRDRFLELLSLSCSQNLILKYLILRIKPLFCIQIHTVHVLGHFLLEYRKNILSVPFVLSFNDVQNEVSHDWGTFKALESSKSYGWGSGRNIHALVEPGDRVGGGGLWDIPYTYVIVSIPKKYNTKRFYLFLFLK